MKGLIVKDLINLKKYSRTVLLIIAFYILFSFMVDSMEFLSGMIVLMCAVSTITSFAYDSQSGWDMYALTLPLPKKNIVLAKYVLALLLTLIGTLLAILAGWLIGLIKQQSNFVETLIVSYSLFAVAVLFLSVLLPLVYRFGVERSRVLIIAVFTIPTAAVIALAQTGAFTMPDETLINQLLVLSPPVLVACASGSIAISCRIFQRKRA